MTDTHALTATLARHIVAARPDTDARAHARQGVLDFLACAAGGVGDGAVQALLRALPAAVADATASSIGAASIVGQARRVDAQTAALVNGTLGHALDFDDVHGSVRGHPSTVILPALLAAAEANGADAAKLLDAYVVGVETMARLGLAVGTSHYETGFHNTATLGTVGATAGVAHLLGLDEAATANALGLAATQSAGLRVQFGTDAKPLHAGLSARNAVFSVALARAGLAGTATFLDGAASFVAVYGGATARPSLAVEHWGQPWQIVSPGLAFKRYPCCNATHYAADAALQLRARHALRADDIAQVTVTFPRGGDTPLLRRLPANRVEARFSIEYVIATAFVEGALPLSAFAEGALRPDLAGWLPRVRCRIDDDVPAVSTDPASRFSTVDVVLRDGRRFSQQVNRLQGAGDLAAKFRDATRGAESLAGVPALVASMSSSSDLADLLAVLRGAPPPAALPTAADALATSGISHE